MKIEQIRQALEVYRTGSINKAARNLFIVQSTLSTSIRSLEKELGQDIFIRKQNGIEVTEFGKKFFRLGQEMLDIYDQIQFLAAKKSCDEKKKKFCISVYYLDFAVREFIDFYTKHKDLNTEFLYYECSKSKVIDYVANGTSELGVLVMSDILKPQWLELMAANGLEYYMLSMEAPKILVGSSSPLAKKEGDTVSFKELEPFDMLWYEEDSELFHTINKTLIKRYNIRNHIRLSGRGSLKEMMRKTEGYLMGTFCENAYRHHPYAEDVRVFRLVEENLHQYEIGYVKKIGVPLSDLGQKYISLLSETIRSD